MTGTTTRTDTIRLWPARAYRDTFAPDAPAPVEGAELPPGWHGLYFLPDLGLDALRPDGTPARDGVVPGIDLPRRLFAGEEMTFHRPIRYGDTLDLTVSLDRMEDKHGRSGRLVFVTIAKTFGPVGDPAVTVRQHDVFLGPADPARPARPQPGPDGHAWEQPLDLGPIHLFRYSALTYNSHLIHYNDPWAREVEGQPGLLVHGPLTSMLLLDFAVRRSGGRTPAAYSMRAVAPVYLGAPVRLAGRPEPGGARLWVLDESGGVLVSADVRFSR
ncbi:3-methylfumaryl-CoA hydratase [Thermocatellispora tengchongensis]|uniref:3-methylfumaryl-CoA hydratase n=1 Tax=Thermocatellispora tengchongensis TaxID=1073253 RepID=A0A840P6F3_9ACTN|nr:MaoC family dehydratase N-terminal domain-containing protein [Thermocatellispora tengchongensis]MBB5136914.1 3-methylfumaryl-CoA hydratase [Thermocatellispora tengchongensis]